MTLCGNCDILVGEAIIVKRCGNKGIILHRDDIHRYCFLDTLGVEVEFRGVVKDIIAGKDTVTRGHHNLIGVEWIHRK